MNYDLAFRISTWITITWVVVIHSFIAFVLLTNLTIGHGGVYAYAMLWPVFLVGGIVICVTNFFFATRSATQDKSSMGLTVLFSIAALVVPQLFVLLLPY
jgi:hypothetical protein